MPSIEEREFWLLRRRALLLEIRAIERRWPSTTITISLRRDEAEKLGLAPDAVESSRKN